MTRTIQWLSRPLNHSKWTAVMAYSRQNDAFLRAIAPNGPVGRTGSAPSPS